MRFGVREICDVVLRAKAAQKIGNKVFYKNEPVCYFDSLKTSTMEGTSSTVYAQGGRGNARLIAWEGERTVTFTMEDALISPIGFSILTGAGLIDATSNKPIIMHTTEQTDQIALKTSAGADYTGASGQELGYVEITLTQEPYLGKNRGETVSGTGDEATVTYTADPKEDFIYVMLLNDHGEVSTEPYIASEVDVVEGTSADNNAKIYKVKVYGTDTNYSDNTGRVNTISNFTKNSVVLVDYYVKKVSDAFQVDITPDKFGGNFYLEASTLFRDTNGVDLPAEFVIPNCKVQSNFTFTMASSGDPSTFTFTMDAFPDYTRWNKLKKVFASIQIIDTTNTEDTFERLSTPHDLATGTAGYAATQKPYIEI